MSEVSRRHDFGPSFMREVSRGPVETSLEKRAEWMVQSGRVSEYLAPKIVYKDKLAGEVERGVSVLSVGSGKGHELDEMDALLPGSNIVGVDPHDYWTDPVAHRAEQLAHHVTYLPETVTAEHLEGVEDASMDGVTLFFVLHHIPQANRIQMMQELSRVTKPDGYVFVAEDLVDSPAEQQIAQQTDRLLNLDVKGRTHEFWSRSQWETFFQKQGFDIVEFHEEKPKHVRHGFFVLKKIPR